MACGLPCRCKCPAIPIHSCCCCCCWFATTKTCRHSATPIWCRHTLCPTHWATTVPKTQLEGSRHDTCWSTTNTPAVTIIPATLAGFAPVNCTRCHLHCRRIRWPPHRTCQPPPPPPRAAAPSGPPCTHRDGVTSATSHLNVCSDVATCSTGAWVREGTTEAHNRKELRAAGAYRVLVVSGC